MEGGVARDEKMGKGKRTGQETGGRKGNWARDRRIGTRKRGSIFFSQMRMHKYNGMQWRKGEIHKREIVERYKTIYIGKGVELCEKGRKRINGVWIRDD